MNALPSTPLPVPGVGRAPCQVELVRYRAGEDTPLIISPVESHARSRVRNQIV